jgi:hypothetical protein
LWQFRLNHSQGPGPACPQPKEGYGAKDDDKGRDKKQGGGNDKKKKKRKAAVLTRNSRRRMRTGRRPLPRREKLTRRKSRDAPGVGASTTWCGSVTRKETADLAKSASTSRTVG